MSHWCILSVLLTLTFSVLPFWIPDFCCGQSTVQFKCPLWDSVFLFEQKGYTLNWISWSCLFVIGEITFKNVISLFQLSATEPKPQRIVEDCDTYYFEDLNNLVSSDWNFWSVVTEHMHTNNMLPSFWGYATFPCTTYCENIIS